MLGTEEKRTVGAPARLRSPRRFAGHDVQIAFPFKLAGAIPVQTEQAPNRRKIATASFQLIWNEVSGRSDVLMGLC